MPTCKSSHGTFNLFCEATTMGHAVEVGECGASWFVGQASRYLDDGLQTTCMVRVEHLTRRTKQMDAFDLWKWTKGCRWQRWQGHGRGKGGNDSSMAIELRGKGGKDPLQANDPWAGQQIPPAKAAGRSEPSNTHDYFDGMRSALNAMSYEQDASEAALRAEVLESIPAHMQHRLLSTLIQSEWSVPLKLEHELDAGEALRWSAR